VVNKKWGKPFKKVSPKVAPVVYPRFLGGALRKLKEHQGGNWESGPHYGRKNLRERF